MGNQANAPFESFDFAGNADTHGLSFTRVDAARTIPEYKNLLSTI
jgi:hypothetical protein